MVLEVDRGRLVHDLVIVQGPLIIDFQYRLLTFCMECQSDLATSIVHILAAYSTISLPRENVFTIRRQWVEAALVQVTSSIQSHCLITT